MIHESDNDSAQAEFDQINKLIITHQETSQFEQAVKIKTTIDFNPNKFLFPPPEALISKSAIVQEEAQSGAQIAFLKL